MAHFIRSLSRRLLPDRLHEISERVYVFDCCLSRNEMSESEYKSYMDATVGSLQKHHPGASYMVFNFHKGDHSESLLSDILSQHDMITVVDYPLHYEKYPLLPLEMIHYFLKSSNSWLSLEGQKNVILVHCEQGGWPVLAFMLASLLLYSKKSFGEHKTLEMVHKQAPKELLTQFSSINPSPSQIRYLKYISETSLAPDWPHSDAPLLIDSLVLINLPLLDEGKGCRPVIQIYGLDPCVKTNRTPRLLFSSLSSGDVVRYYHKEECLLVKLEINRHVQGDVFLECINFGEDLVTQETVFRVMFHTAFVQSNVLILGLDEMDALWDAKNMFPKDFKAEVLFSSLEEDQADISTEVATEQEEKFYESESEFFEAEEFDILDSDDHYIDNWRKHNLPDNYIIEDLGNDAESESSFWRRNPEAMFSVESFKELPLDDDDDVDDRDKEGGSDASSVENIVIIDKTEKTDPEGDEEAIAKSKHVVVLAVSLDQDTEVDSVEADYEPKFSQHPGQYSDIEADDADQNICVDIGNRDGDTKQALEDSSEAASSEGRSETYSTSKSNFLTEGTKEDDSEVESELKDLRSNIAVADGSQEYHVMVEIGAKTTVSVCGTQVFKQKKNKTRRKLQDAVTKVVMQKKVVSMWVPRPKETDQDTMKQKTPPVYKWVAKGSASEGI